MILNYKKASFQNKHVNNKHRCLISTKHGSAYDSDVRLLLSFYKTNWDKIYSIFPPSGSKRYNRKKSTKIRSIGFTWYEYRQTKKRTEKNCKNYFLGLQSLWAIPKWSLYLFLSNVYTIQSSYCFITYILYIIYINIKTVKILEIINS